MLVELAPENQGVTRDESSTRIYALEFAIGEQQYRLEFIQAQDGYGTNRWDVELARIGEWTRELRFAVDEDANTATAWVPRDWLTSESGQPLWGVRGLDEITLTSTQLEYLGIGQGVADRLPDAGTLSWLPAHGSTESDFEIRAKRPLRQSNGGTQAMLFEVEATGVPDGQYTWSYEAPKNWHVVLPDTLHVEGGSFEENILVSIPGAHGHGNLELVHLALTGPATGSLDLGVAFAQPAFPTAHHPTLWLHSHVAAETAEPYMNTLLNDDLDAQAPVKFQGGAFDQVLMVPLLPTLGMPMAIDVDGSANVQLSIRPIGGEPAPNVHAEVIRTNAMETEILWDFGDVGYLSTPGSSLEYDYNATWVGTNPVIDPKDGTNLFLRIEVTELGQQVGGYTVAAELLPGGLLALPLHEYQPDIGAFFSSISQLGIQGSGTALRAAPGSSVVMAVALQNLQARAREVDISIDATYPEWLLWDSATSTIASQGDLHYDVQLDIPDDAQDPNEVRFTVREGGTLVGLHSFTVFPDERASIVHEEATARPAPDGRQSPGIPTVGLVVALACFALWRRQ